MLMSRTEYHLAQRFLRVIEMLEFAAAAVIVFVLAAVHSASDRGIDRIDPALRRYLHH